MRRFHFPLATLLWHRTTQEEVAEQVLARALQRERETEQALRRITAQAGEEAKRLGEALRGSLDGAGLDLSARFQLALGLRTGVLQQRLDETRERVRSDRATVRDRRRAREVVSQLRARAWSRYRAADEHEVQVGLDEMASGRHLQRTAGIEE
jgi:flagellar export protein FliJ